MKIDRQGIVHGKTIELERPLGLPDGQPVVVSVTPLHDGAPATRGEGIRRSAGGWSDDPAGLEDYLEWNRQQRKVERRELGP